MKYTITKIFTRNYNTEQEIPVQTIVVKFKTETGYVGRVEMPSGMRSEENIKKAIKKEIENAMLLTQGGGSGKPPKPKPKV